MPSHALLSSVVVAALLAAVPAMAVEYTFTDLGRLEKGQSLVATDLNASGQVVGFVSGAATDGGARVQAFVTGPNGRGMTWLGSLGGGDSRALAINDAGEITGQSLTASGASHAFFAAPGAASLRDLGSLPGAASSAGISINASGQVLGDDFVSAAHGGALRPLGTLDGQPLHAADINASGQIIGSTGGVEFPRVGFVTGPGGAAPVRLPGDQLPVGVAINDAGQIAGDLGWEGVSHDAFLGDGDQLTLINFTGVPGYQPGLLGGSGQYGPASKTYARDVNGLGQVVGTFDNIAATRTYAFVTGPDGKDVVNVSLLLDLPPGEDGRPFSLQSVDAINDAGQFIANANNGHAYLVTPIPEPALSWLFLAGVGLVGGMGRRGVTGDPITTRPGHPRPGTCPSDPPHR